jgi:hypothetical protein
MLGLGPSVRPRNEGSMRKNSPICIGVGLDDVGIMVEGFFRGGRLGLNVVQFISCVLADVSCVLVDDHAPEDCVLTS